MCVFCLPDTSKLGGRNRSQVQRLSGCCAALHLAKRAHVSKLKNTEQSQAQLDRPYSAFNSRSEPEFSPSLLVYFLLSIEYKTPSLTPDSEKIISGVCRYSIKNMIGESPAMIISARSASGPKISARSLRSIPSHSV